MTLRPRFRLPRMIERGKAQTLDLDVYSAAGAQQTASAATLTLYAGSKVILDAVSDTALGPPVTRSLLASDTEDESLSDDWLEVWSLTISGTAYTFQRPAYLVRRVLYPVITDTDLTDLHSDLADLRDTDQASYEAQRSAAWSWLNGELIRRGSRPELVVDSWALAQLHIYKALSIIFRDFALSVGDGRYAELADYYDAQLKSEWDRLTFRYDADESGTLDEDESETRAGQPTVWLNLPPTW